MWAITKVTDTETKRLGQHVRTMKSLAGQIDETNPAKVATAANTSRIAALTKSMQSQAALLQNATNSIVPSRAMAYSAIGASNGNNQMGAGTGLDAFQNQRPINVNVFNPVAERASDSTARKLRQLSDMGAL
jgi:hypothetical protein